MRSDKDTLGTPSRSRDERDFAACVVKNLLARWLSAPEEEVGGASDDDDQCNSMDATRMSVPTLFIAAPMEGIQIIQLDAGYGHNLAFAEDRPKEKWG